MFQSPSLVTELTAFQNVALAAGPEVSASRIGEALELLLPSGSSALLASELSGGMTRLTELARALLSGGRAVVLDEPFTGLDAETRIRACAFIADNLHGRPLLVATHDPADAELLDARIVSLTDGASLH